jgi:hypothetical protein
MLEKNGDLYKKCSVCSRDLPITSFYAKGARFDASCKICVKKKKKKKRQKKSRKIRVGVRQIAFDQCKVVTLHGYR